MARIERSRGAAPLPEKPGKAEKKPSAELKSNIEKTQQVAKGKIRSFIPRIDKGIPPSAKRIGKVSSHAFKQRSQT